MTSSVEENFDDQYEQSLGNATDDELTSNPDGEFVSDLEEVDEPDADEAEYKATIRIPASAYDDEDELNSRLEAVGVPLFVTIKRNRDGSYLRPTRQHPTVLFVKNRFPLGSYVYRRSENPSGVPDASEWVYFSDCPKFSVRFTKGTNRFAIPHKLPYSKICEAKFGSVIETRIFDRIGILCNHEWDPTLPMYLIPRELVDENDLKQFPSDVGWFADSDQNSGLSKLLRLIQRDYSEFLPRADDDYARNTMNYGLCTHRRDLLVTYKGSLPLERHRMGDIGHWFTCFVRGNKACNLARANRIPIETYLGTYSKQKGVLKTSVLIRDVMPTPTYVKSVFKRQDVYRVSHPLLGYVFFPHNVTFHSPLIDVCFAMIANGCGVNEFFAVAVNNGHGMTWFHDLPQMVRWQIQQNDFAFIHTSFSFESQFVVELDVPEFEFFDPENAVHQKMVGFVPKEVVPEPPPLPEEPKQRHPAFLENANSAGPNFVFRKLNMFGDAQSQWSSNAQDADKPKLQRNPGLQSFLGGMRKQMECNSHVCTNIEDSLGGFE